MPEEYKACGTQLECPPEHRGVPYDDWVKTRPVATKADIAAWLKKISSQSAEPKKKAHSGALPDNTEWL